MIDHDIGFHYDPLNPPAPDFSPCRSATDIERVLATAAPGKPVDWSTAMRAMKHPATPVLDKHPSLAALAEVKNRTVEVLDALAALGEHA